MKQQAAASQLVALISQQIQPQPTQPIFNNQPPQFQNYQAQQPVNGNGATSLEHQREEEYQREA